MRISIQDRTGHSTLEGLSDAEVDAKFSELVTRGYMPYIDTKIDEAKQVRTVEEARDAKAEEIFFTAPLVGG